MAKKIAQGVGQVHVTNPENGEVHVYHEGDTVREEHQDLLGDHVFEDADVADSEIDLVAGPSQGLSDADQDEVAKARKAAASRRARAAKKAAEGEPAGEPEAPEGEQS